MEKLLVLALLSSCASASPAPEPGPRGLRANDHLSVARQEEDSERRAAIFPDTRSGSPTDPPIGVWQRSWAPADHERLATIHRAHAAEIEADFAEACAPFQSWEMNISPLARFGVGGWNTTTGVIVYLTPEAGDAERLLARLRCHRAWMMLGRSDMENCPLDLAGIMLDARGNADGVTVSIVARDPSTIAELQRRTALDLETAHRARTSAQP